MGTHLYERHQAVFEKEFLGCGFWLYTNWNDFYLSFEQEIQIWPKVWCASEMYQNEHSHTTWLHDAICLTNLFVIIRSLSEFQSDAISFNRIVADKSQPVTLAWANLVETLEFPFNNIFLVSIVGGKQTR